MSLINADNTSVSITVDVAQALLAFASRNKATPHFKSIILEGQKLWATDGHAAVSFLTRRAGTSAMLAWKRDYVETQMKVAKATKNHDFVLQFDQSSNEFLPYLPNIHHIMPSTGIVGTSWRSFNPSHFADLEKVCKACGSSSVVLDTLGNSKEPIGFTVDGPEGHARVVIMPKQGAI